ncbi:unnamed protein product [Nesidiocoris tenuis]|uniref:Uncharacterized protein n=1 Tax=Nesidiocoris tenuis TaxID=355587 RepID=A0A6H5G137_9HEMI|nr:unnamed protein product [Nesidiocoris tenuis]
METLPVDHCIRIGTFGNRIIITETIDYCGLGLHRYQYSIDCSSSSAKSCIHQSLLKQQRPPLHLCLIQQHHQTLLTPVLAQAAEPDSAPVLAPSAVPIPTPLPDPAAPPNPAYASPCSSSSVRSSSSVHPCAIAFNSSSTQQFRFRSLTQLVK